MEKYRAIPEGYMRVGEIAKKAGVTVRTLQYYDKEGLLSPSAESDGGFRLYNDKDMAKLIQIIMMKQLGIPLSEIKKRLAALDTPSDVINVLTDQANAIRKKIEVLSESLSAIEALKEEVEQMEVVDFKLYVAILLNLEMKNENYWMVKHFDDDILKHFEENVGAEKAMSMVEEVNRLQNEALELKNAGVDPESEQGQKFAKTFWETMLELTGGDVDILMKMSEQVEKISNVDKRWNEKALAVNTFLGESLEAYFNKVEGKK